MEKLVADLMIKTQEMLQPNPGLFPSRLLFDYFLLFLYLSTCEASLVVRAVQKRSRFLVLHRNALNSLPLSFSV